MRIKKDIAEYSNDDLLRDIEAWERINRVPDTYPLSPKQAAVLMTFSERTLQAWRKESSGPAYYQGGVKVEPGRTGPDQGTNQHVRYFKADIASWWQKNMTTSIKEAQRLKGQTFVTSIEQLAEEAPFYVDGLGQIEGMVEERTLGELLERADSNIQWLPVAQAACQKWADMAAHQALANKVKSVLNETLARVDTGLESTEIASASAAGRKRG